MYKRDFLQVAAVGTVRHIQTDFAVVSVVIENPSDMWLYLSTLDMYIGPRTNGNRFNLTIPTQSFDISYVNAPTGGAASAATGGPIVVTTYDGLISDLQGIPYDLIPALNSLITAINNLATLLNLLGAAFIGNTLENTITITADGGAVQIIPAAGVGQQNVLLAWSIEVDTAGILGDDLALSAPVTATIFGGNINDLLSISPDHPSDSHGFWPFGLRRGDNGNVSVNALSTDSSWPAITVTAVWAVA